MAGTGSRAARVGVVATAVVLTLFVFPSVALAWSADVTGDCVYVERGSLDTTGPVGLSIYYGYVGGPSWDEPYPCGSVGSYSDVLAVGELGAGCIGVEVPMVPYYGPQLVVVSDGAVPVASFAAVRAPVVVGSLDGTSVPVAVQSVLPGVASLVGGSIEGFPVDVIDVLTYGIPLVLLAAGIGVGLVVRRS